MALATFNHKSKILKRSVSFYGAFPDSPSGKFRTLYLLHGLSDDYSTWVKNSSIVRYAEKRGIAVIMPEGGRSFYTDMAYGPRYYSYIIKELIDYTRKIFNLSDKREDTFAAGLSMGGYGAFKFALGNPDVFAGAASLSGCLDVAGDLIGRHNNRETEYMLVTGGEDATGTENDLFYLADHYEKPESLKLFQTCGTGDFLYDDNLSFREFIKDKGFAYKYSEYPGVHNWDFWDGHIEEAIDYLFET
ncbi:MAG: alpha/beta hydrolase family protein [Bacillota bacterium]|nr:alpha/beta hydrolase family protein [Bacillota bacterium]